VWDIEEIQQYRFFLSGFDDPRRRQIDIPANSYSIPLNILSLFDKFVIFNFFLTFLEPTIDRLNEMDKILINLKDILDHQPRFKLNSGRKIQLKAELFIRILTAKLSALQELDNLIYRIFNLFEIPKIQLGFLDLSNPVIDFNALIQMIANDVSAGISLLNSVSEKIRYCQLSLRDYMSNGVKTTDSFDEFSNALKPLANLSVDLFIEAEILRLYGDFFGNDVPYFSFDTDLFNTQAKKLASDVKEDTIIAVRGLFKNYNLGNTTVYALRGVSLDIKEGEFVAIVGTSGAGKTTLLNCMAGLDTPDNGVVLFRGQNLHKMKDRAKSNARLLEMGFIFQSYALLPHYDTRENVALPADLAGLSNELRDRVEELLLAVGIDQQAKQFPAQLSGGQMQRVAIARALTNQPTVIFADEPTGDLDSVTGKQVMDLLKKFHEETNTTVIVITHDPEVATYATRQIKMKDGVLDLYT
jgi:putative ABC transport system ATP-binding protein